MKGFQMLLFISATFNSAFAQNEQPEMNVIYGDHHIYTVETPTGWINDKKAAESIGLTNFFYHADDAENEQRTYIFTNGYDKASSTEDLTTFVAHDLKTFLEKYPDAEYTSLEMGHTPPILDGITLSFSNLSDRYREEIVYLETKESIILIVFAAFSQDDYDKYVDVFDVEFTGSFKYRGNNPKPFLDWMNSK